VPSSAACNAVVPPALPAHSKIERTKPWHDQPVYADLLLPPSASNCSSRKIDAANRAELIYPDRRSPSGTTTASYSQSSSLIHGCHWPDLIQQGTAVQRDWWSNHRPQQRWERVIDEFTGGPSSPTVASSVGWKHDSLQALRSVARCHTQAGAAREQPWAGKTLPAKSRSSLSRN